jgi:hypothetical protein
VSTFDDSTAPALQRKMRGRGLTLTHDGGDHRAERGEAAPAGSGRRRMGAGRGRRGSLRPPTGVAGRLGGGGGSPDGGSCGGWGRPQTRRIGGGEEEARPVKGSNHAATTFSALFTRHNAKGHGAI